MNAPRLRVNTPSQAYCGKNSTSHHIFIILHPLNYPHQGRQAIDIMLRLQNVSELIAVAFNELDSSRDGVCFLSCPTAG